MTALPQILVLQIRPFPGDQEAQPEKRDGRSNSTPQSRVYSRYAAPRNLFGIAKR